jgi:hypothetical protein
MKLFYTFLALLSGCQLATSQIQSFEPTLDVSGKEFGTRVAISDNEILASTVSTETSPGKVYLFNINLQQTGVFYPEDSQLTDGFGNSFSIDSDFIAIGAPYHDAHNIDSGAVYTYRKVDNEWQFFQKIITLDNNAGDSFGGVVKVYNNQLFISAVQDEPDNQPINNNNGSVYVYNWDGAQWSFSEKLISTGSWAFFGNKIEVDDTTLVISSGFEDQVLDFTIYKKNGLQWEFLQIVNVNIGGEIQLRDISLNNHILYTLGGAFGGSGVQLHQQNQAGIWEEITGQNDGFGAESIEPYYLFSQLKINGDRAYFGITNSFQSGDKFPLACFKNSLPWSWMEHRIYGNGPSGQDDRFGSAIAIDNQSVVIGAPKEGNGKVYFANEDVLEINNFQQSTTSVYPNPVNNVLNINSDFNNITNTEIYSITGKLLLSVGNNPKEINLENIESGMYFVKITTPDGNNQSFKIIKN